MILLIHEMYLLLLCIIRGIKKIKIEFFRICKKIHTVLKKTLAFIIVCVVVVWKPMKVVVIFILFSDILSENRCLTHVHNEKQFFLSDFFTKSNIWL